jgi:hypothetical protein
MTDQSVCQFSPPFPCAADRATAGRHSASEKSNYLRLAAGGTWRNPSNIPEPDLFVNLHHSPPPSIEVGWQFRMVVMLEDARYLSWRHAAQ